MLIVVAVWLVVLAAWMVWHLRAQVQEIRQFTDPVAAAIEPEQPDAEELTALRGRLSAFAEEVEAGRAATLRLSAADLNHLLAAQEPVNRLKDSMIVEEIDSAAIRLRVALALNGMPGERLFLNGIMTARPEVASGKGLMLSTRSVEVPGKTVTQGFLERYLEANHLDSLFLDEIRKSDRLSKLLLRITTARTEPDAVILEFVPPTPPTPAARPG